MRRMLFIAALIAAAVALLAARPSSGDGDEYLVRAVFDNGSFVVPGEDVRIAGANVGHVESVAVSKPGEVVSAEPGEEEQPGKAIVVLNITDPAFQDFRADASCILRPQSLIGERYVNCRPTRPRGPDAELPPSLEEIPDGQPGEGQRLLPLENNATNVDVDLLQNVQREPYADRFRIILNELGIGFAARGEEVAEIVERADPTLREINRVLAILTDQRRRLAQLASDSDEILRPLARARTSVTGFMRNAGTTAEATAGRRAELEAALAEFPGFLRELRATMADFEGFSDAALPVTAQLGIAAPSLTSATQKLEPFSSASTTALRSFGEAAEASGETFVAADPIVRKTRNVARGGVRPTRDLSHLLRSTRRTGGFERLMDLIYNTGGSFNGFDSYGHFMRTALVPTNCLDYANGYTPSCDANFKGDAYEGQPADPDVFPVLEDDTDPTPRRVDARDNASGTASLQRDLPNPIAPNASGDDEEAADGGRLEAEAQADAVALQGAPGAAPPRLGGSTAPRTQARAVRQLLDFLVGGR